MSKFSACDLLIEKVPVDVNLTSEKRETIANLTGQIPLALQIIASLLTLRSRPSADEIILELEKDPIKTLSHDKLPAKSQINASFSLSYKYLNQELRIIGSYIAYFPGSFRKEAAVHSTAHLIHGSSHENLEGTVVGALRSLVDRSLLEFSTRTDRFHYHRLIREFFHAQNIHHESKLESFLSGFHHFYSKKLYVAAMSFNMNHKPSLAFLDTERHNIQMLLNNLAVKKVSQQDESIAVITAVAAALDFDFLICRFTGEELLQPLHGALTYLDHHIEKYVTQLSHGPRKLDCDYEYQISFSPHRLVCTYETLIHHLAEIENELHGPESALRVYGDRKDVMERIKQPWNTRPYIDFLKRLAHYYRIIGFKAEEIECHMRINKLSQQFTDIICRKERCRYVDIAKMYASSGNDKDAARFYELSLEKEHHHQVIQKVEIHCELCRIYEHLRLYNKAMDIFEKLILMHSEIMNVPASQIYRYNDVIWNVVSLYRQYEKHDEATMLEEKLVESVSDIGTVPDQQTLTAGVNIARHMFHGRNYQKSIQIGQNILRGLSMEKINIQGIALDVITQEIKILIGRAKFHSGEYSAGLDDLEAVFMDLTFVSEIYTDFICKYLIFRPSKYLSSCTEFKLRPYTIFLLGRAFYYMLFVSPLPLIDKAVHLLAKPRQPLDHITAELVTVGGELEIWDFFQQIRFRTYFEQFIYGIVKSCTKSTLFCLVIYITSIFIRLGMLYILCKFILKLIRFANQHPCAVLLIIIFDSLVLTVLFLPLYLMYLHWIM